MRLSTLLSLGLGLSLAGLLSHSAFAAGDDKDDDDEDVGLKNTEFNLDDFGDDEEEDAKPAPKRLDEADQQTDDDENIEEGSGGLGPRIELDDDDIGDDKIGGPGQDNSTIYREYIDGMNDLGPEEELLAWERYLKKYPNTLFRDRIERRMDELTDEIYGERIGGEGDGYSDAKDRELNFANPVQLENIDPRTRLRISGELGPPEYIAGMADFELQLMRPWSVHAGLRTRYTGANIEVGSRYSLVKSARLNLLVTGALDLHYNTQPGFLGVRPTLSAGKTFPVGGGLSVAAQLGADVEVPQPDRADQLGRKGGVRTVGGVFGYYQASEVVGLYAETSLTMKNIAWAEGGTFAFDVLTFGLRFTPKLPTEVKFGVNAGVPFYYNYWGYNFGTVQAEALWYPDMAPMLGGDSAPAPARTTSFDE